MVGRSFERLTYTGSLANTRIHAYNPEIDLRLGLAVGPGRRSVHLRKRQNLRQIEGVLPQADVLHGVVRAGSLAGRIREITGFGRKEKNDLEIATYIL